MVVVAVVAVVEVVVVVDDEKQVEGSLYSARNAFLGVGMYC